MGYHFGSKADLLVAAFEQLCDGYREMLGMLSEEPTADPVEAASKLDEALRKSFVWPARFRERQYAYFGFWAMARTDAKLRMVNRRVYDEVAAYLGMLLGSIARARGRTINEKAAGLELSATIDGAWLHLTTGVDGFTREIALRICSECVARILERDDVPSGPS